jgi:epoxyqueuosine reductase QueG
MFVAVLAAATLFAQPAIAATGRMYGCDICPQVCPFFNKRSRLRDEFLFGTPFANVSEAQVLCNALRCEYNEERPHQSLGYLSGFHPARAHYPVA